MATIAERWRNIPGFPGYKVSDRGRVASFKRVELKLMRPRVTKSGRHAIQLEDRAGRKHTLQIGALVLQVYTGEDGDRVYHMNDDPSDNTLTNLMWAREGDDLTPVMIEGKEYVSINDFAKLVNKSYQTIYLLARYGTHDGKIKLESILWNNRRLILLEDRDKIDQIAPVGRPRRGESNGSG